MLSQHTLIEYRVSFIFFTFILLSANLVDQITNFYPGQGNHQKNQTAFWCPRDINSNNNKKELTQKYAGRETSVFEPSPPSAQ